MGVRDLLALTRLYRLGALRGSQGLAEGQAWHLLISSSGLQPFPSYQFVSCLQRLLPTLLPYRPLPSTPCDSCSAYLLPTVHLGNTALHSSSNKAIQKEKPIALAWVDIYLVNSIINRARRAAFIGGYKGLIDQP